MKSNSKLKSFVVFILSAVGAHALAQDVIQKELTATEKDGAFDIQLKFQVADQTTATSKTLTMASGNWTTASIEELEKGQLTESELRALLATGNWAMAKTTMTLSSNSNVHLVNEPVNFDDDFESIRDSLSTGNWTMKRVNPNTKSEF